MFIQIFLIVLASCYSIAVPMSQLNNIPKKDVSFSTILGLLDTELTPGGGGDFVAQALNQVLPDSLKPLAPPIQLLLSQYNVSFVSLFPVLNSNTTQQFIQLLGLFNSSSLTVQDLTNLGKIFQSNNATKFETDFAGLILEYPEVLIIIETVVGQIRSNTFQPNNILPDITSIPKGFFTDLHNLIQKYSN